jgi:hypothetical protein
MRVSVLTVVLILTCAAASATAQAVIDVDGQKVAPPNEQDRRQAQPAGQPSIQPQEKSQANPPTRFSFNRVESGFLRLDNDSGEVAYCSAQAAGWKCQAIPIQRAADVEGAKNDVTFLKGLKAEIARLQEEITSLKKEVAELKEPPPPRPPADLTPNSDKGTDVTIKLPNPEEMARARDFVESAWRRLVEMLVTMQKDLMRKS